MISVENALKLISEHALPFQGVQTLTLEDALGKVVAENIVAPISLPPFRQAIMDGYALQIGNGLLYNVIGEIKTGDASSLQLKPNEAVRIFTGAIVPDSANAVVMQEHVTVNGNNMQLKELPKNDSHIREIGEQIKKGDISLTKGEKLNPSAIGILKSFGLAEVSVFRNPKITVITTGNELVEAGKMLKPGQIYDSNSHVLIAALKQKGIEVRAVTKVKDSLKETEIAINEAFNESDIILISGGISVGDYDFVSKALKNLQVTEIFYKVLQKPGKPLYFGRKENTYVFALPGNPASTLTCLYVYVFGCIDLLCGNKNSGLPRIQFPISEDFENPSEKGLFLKAKLNGHEVVVLNQQNSAMVLSFARADALVYFPSHVKKIQKGDLVTTILLPSVS